jgi:hypothetical protein
MSLGAKRLGGYPLARGVPSSTHPRNWMSGRTSSPQPEDRKACLKTLAPLTASPRRVEYIYRRRRDIASIEESVEFHLYNPTKGGEAWFVDARLFPFCIHLDTVTFQKKLWFRGTKPKIILQGSKEDKLESLLRKVNVQNKGKTATNTE